MKPQQIGQLVLIVSIIILSLLLWFKFQTDAQTQNACEQTCGALGGTSCSIESCPFHQNDGTSWIVVVASILVAFLGATGLYLAFPRKKEHIIEEKEYDLTSLKDEEKNIFLFIKEQKEGVYQSEVTKQFNLSKVQATRLLDKLEGMDLVERRRRGLSNMVRVK